jgi:hypothetical protein
MGRIGIILYPVSLVVLVWAEAGIMSSNPLAGHVGVRGSVSVTTSSNDANGPAKSISPAHPPR